MANTNDTESEKFLRGTSGNDYIKNGISRYTVRYGEDEYDEDYDYDDDDDGYQEELEKSNNVTIDAAAGDDTINNYGSGVSINAGAGNDFINNTATVKKIYTGAYVSDSYEDEEYFYKYIGGAFKHIPHIGGRIYKAVDKTFCAVYRGKDCRGINTDTY